jgi:hypothetical protein
MCEFLAAMTSLSGKLVNRCGLVSVKTLYVPLTPAVKKKNTRFCIKAVVSYYMCHKSHARVGRSD